MATELVTDWLAHHKPGKGHPDRTVKSFAFQEAESISRRAKVRWAARNGHTHVCRWLVEDHHVSPDAPTSDGTTPLHLAAAQGHQRTCAYLADEAGADAAATNDVS